MTPEPHLCPEGHTASRMSGAVMALEYPNAKKHEIYWVCFRCKTVRGGAKWHPLPKPRRVPRCQD